jgi:hypothetical protein
MVRKTSARGFPPGLQPPPALTIIASTDNPLDKGQTHCFNQDDSRKLTFTISASHISAGSTSVLLVNRAYVDWMAKNAQGNPGGASTKIGMEAGVAQLSQATTISFGPDTNEQSESQKELPDHKGDYNPYYHLGSGPDGMPGAYVALVSVTAAGQAKPAHYLYHYRTWKKSPSECSQ